MRIWIIAGATLAVLAAALALSGQFGGQENQHVVSVSVPDLSSLAQSGQSRFGTFCAQCHGASGQGSDKGPPLIHQIYHPGHHGDGAFYAAAKSGSRQHHWQFGNMPPVEGIADADIEAIVAYIRELQSANGIF